MITGCYKGLEVTTLETMKADALAQLTLVRQGKRIFTAVMAGKTVQKSLPTMDELKSELAEISFALKADTTTASDGYGKPRRRFRPDYRNRMK